MDWSKARLAKHRAARIDAPCVSPGRGARTGNTRRLSLLCCLCLPAIARVWGAPSDAAAPDAFRVHSLAYDAGGRLGAGGHGRLAVETVFYGEPVASVVRMTGPPTSGGTLQGPPTVSDPSEALARSPARPVRPQFTVDRWDQEDGLPASKVTDLLQTRDGYLWISTVGGVARFDGRRFVRLHLANGEGAPVDAPIPRALFEDDNGRLWVGTDDGLRCFQGTRPLPDSAGSASLRGVAVRCFARRRAGGFWMGAGDRVACWDGTQVRSCAQVHGESASASRVLALAESADGALWVGTFRGLWRAAPGEDRLDRVDLGPGDTAGINGLWLDQRQRLWIGSGAGLWRVDPGTTSPMSVSAADGASSETPLNSEFCADVTGALWATSGTGNGIYRVAETSGPVDWVRVAPEVRESYRILTDREGAIWVGTRDSGLFRLRRQSFTTLALNSNSILDHTRSLCEAPDGRLWFAGRMGVARWSGRELVLVALGALGTRSSAPLTIDSGGDVWTSHPAGGWLELPSRLADDPVRTPAVPVHPELGEIQTMLHTREGTLWIGSRLGLHRHRLGSDTAPQPAWTAGEVRVLLEARNGGLWMGTAMHGVLHHGADGVRPLTAEPWPDRGPVFALHESADGSLWIGTSTGVHRWRRGRLDHFGPASSLPQSGVHCLLEDEVDRLWMSCGGGILRVARADLDAWLLDAARLPAVAEFGRADGLVNLESAGGNPPTGLRTRDGRLWFPTRRGVAVVDPRECPPRPEPPRVWIESTRVDGELLVPGGAPRLPAGRGREAAFEFAPTTLHSPERALVQYRLDGYDRQWRDAGPLRVARYTRLPHGDYQFRVRVRDHEGRWSTADAVLAFSIDPFLWHTWPFRGVCGALALGAGLGASAWRRRRARHREAAERRRSLEQERLRIARDMHDHLGAQLAALALATEGADGARHRVQDTLRELNDLIWSVHPRHDTLPSLVDFVSNFASRFLGTAGVALELDLPEPVPTVPLPSPVRLEIAALFKEALRNVVQHARATRVVIRLRLTGPRLNLSVRDNGQGFELASRNPSTSDPQTTPDGPRVGGNGLRNFATRCRDLDGTCHIRSTPGAGTEVVFEVPVDTRPCAAKP